MEFDQAWADATLPRIDRFVVRDERLLILPGIPTHDATLDNLNGLATLREGDIALDRYVLVPPGSGKPSRPWARAAARRSSSRS